MMMNEHNQQTDMMHMGAMDEMGEWHSRTDTQPLTYEDGIFSKGK